MLGRLLSLGLFGLSLCAADVCNPTNLQGPYGFQLSGTTAISGDTQPAASLGRIVFDGQGGISGYSSVMFAGLLLGNPVTGTYEARPDCTVTWSLQDDSGGFQHFSGVITADGRRMRFRQTDPGGVRDGLLQRTSDECTVSDLRKQYDFSLSGSYTPMMPGDIPAKVDATGKMAADPYGSFTLNRRGGDGAPADVALDLESDCVVHLEFTLPAKDGQAALPLNLRGILVDGAREILAIATDPGWMLSATFTGQ
ncbi:MAG TPA: hypothetical protein VMG35_29185 [Bryobacteraceae bacterium]|nr:hypothetical protein [Bryobacteraceae bacterium]